jgi:hypothetical protein
MTTGNSEYCDPGDFAAFSLADGGAGFYQCLGDGSAYVLYSGPNPNEPPEDAGSYDAAGACSTAGGQKLGFMCAGCTTNEDCGTQDGMPMVCFSFPNKGGNLCTLSCTTATSSVCVAPSAGCGNNGHCKPSG